MTREQKRFWRENGYLILPAFFSPQDVDAVNEIVESRIAAPGSFGAATVDPLEGVFAGKRFRAAEAPKEVWAGAVKINDLFLDEPAVMKLALGERLTGLLMGLLDGPPAVCNSLNFIWGSQQPAHVDSWFMPAPIPKNWLRLRIRRRFGHHALVRRLVPELWNPRLAVSSVCLEDVREDAGPLTFYPRSHRIPPYRSSGGMYTFPVSEAPLCRGYVEREIKKRGLALEHFVGRKGDVFLWHGQLVHGGAPILAKQQTRKTLVTHYWRAQDMDPERVLQLHNAGFYEKRTHQQA
ncbi:MAG TPA: phytanoyl-CoA dioxygenase family protein [Bryobacteraceae bacterium]|nr:phytanoyl-CoA dioxygenase family protein [Bryobacteraceae bacterium]